MATDKQLIGRIGGLVKASRYPPTQLTQAARDGFLKRFESKDTTLSAEEKERRARAGLKAHMMRLARLSAKVRANGGKKVKHG